MTFSSHALDRPDATIRYWISRPDERSTAPTVVLLHGATLDHHAWDPQVTALRGRFTPAAQDLRAQGESTGPSGFTAAVADVQALLELLPAERVVLVGLSLGGN